MKLFVLAVVAAALAAALHAQAATVKLVVQGTYPGPLNGAGPCSSSPVKTLADLPVVPFAVQGECYDPGYQTGPTKVYNTFDCTKKSLVQVNNCSLAASARGNTYFVTNQTCADSTNQAYECFDVDDSKLFVVKYFSDLNCTTSANGGSTLRNYALLDRCTRAGYTLNFTAGLASVWQTTMTTKDAATGHYVVRTWNSSKSCSGTDYTEDTFATTLGACYTIRAGTSPLSVVVSAYTAPPVVIGGTPSAASALGASREVVAVVVAAVATSMFALFA